MKAHALLPFLRSRVDWLKLSGNDHSVTTLDSCEKRPVKIACGIEGDSAVTLEEGAGGGGMGGTVAGLVLDVMAGVLLVVTVVGAIVPVGDTSLVVVAVIKQDVTVHVGGCTLHVTVAGTIPDGKVAVITLHPTVGTITLDVTVVGITKDVVELKGTSGIE